MILKEVKTKKEALLFNKLPKAIYKNDKEWISHLYQDVEAVFSPILNPFFKTGECIRWIMLNNNQEVIGRVAAFYHIKNADKDIDGGMGFFECINNQAAAFLLFDACKNWLLSKGIKTMLGPINFGEKDRFWGLMVSGFKNPSYLENYNPPYYQSFFENYGFIKHVEQSTSEVTIEGFNFERFNKIASRVLQNPNYSFRHYNEDQMEQFASDFAQIYNLAWAHREDFSPMTLERVKTTLVALKPILKEDLIWFAYANNQPAGFYINTIEVNQIFKHLHGKMNWWAKVKFLWYRKFGKVNRCRGIVFGVIPACQNLGLEVGMIMKFYDAVMRSKHLRASELSWIGDFNPKMHSLFNALGAKTSKIHYTYKFVVHD